MYKYHTYKWMDHQKGHFINFWNFKFYCSKLNLKTEFILPSSVNYIQNLLSYFYSLRTGSVASKCQHWVSQGDRWFVSPCAPQSGKLVQLNRQVLEGAGETGKILGLSSLTGWTIYFQVNFLRVVIKNWLIFRFQSGFHKNLTAQLPCARQQRPQHHGSERGGV